jgi:peptidoglycan/xylan/chitin deacetylase (PgdA/CDA1 family)
VETNKPIDLSYGTLIALLAFCGSLALGFMWPVNPNASDGETKNLQNTGVQTETRQRIQNFKAAMLVTWQKEARTKGLSYGIPPRFQGATIKQAQVAKNDKVIALTFDDGPWPEYTAQVLDILKQHNLKATFFVVGQVLKNYPDIGKRIVDEGHVIGNHTWHHWYHFFNKQAAAFEIDSTSNLIYQITGAKTTLFRPPGGHLHNGLAAYARSKKYTVVMWSADSLDYQRPAASVLVNRVLKESTPGGIVLLHDGGGNRSSTVNALPQLISSYKKQGYRFVTIPELLELQEKNEKMIASQKQ